MKMRHVLELGRISNLPTVWSNCLVGVLMAAPLAEQITTQEAHSPLVFFVLASFAISLMYLGGMFLNDAFDAKWDAQHKADKLIPSGKVSEKEVWIYGFAFLLAGPAAIALSLFYIDLHNSVHVLLSITCLAAAIVAYDGLHKHVSFGPWIMGSCRLFVYTSAALTFGDLNTAILIAGFSMMAYIIGLTYIAKTEHLNHPGHWWPVLFFAAPIISGMYFSFTHPLTLIFIGIYLLWSFTLIKKLLPGEKRNIPAAIGGLLAGIPLIDAIMLAGNGYPLFALIAIGCFIATLLFHNKISGT